MTPQLVLAVLGAGACAALIRYLVSFATAAPWAVLAVNVVGSAIGGWVLGGDLDPALRLVVLTGFAGGLTTFSTLSVETVQLVQEGRLRTAVSSVLLNLVLGIGAATLAFALAAM